MELKIVRESLPNKSFSESIFMSWISNLLTYSNSLNFIAQIVIFAILSENSFPRLHQLNAQTVFLIT